MHKRKGTITLAGSESLCASRLPLMAALLVPTSIGISWKRAGLLLEVKQRGASTFFIS
jgi:hypothetical protein